MQLVWVVGWLKLRYPAPSSLRHCHSWHVVSACQGDKRWKDSIMLCRMFYHLVWKWWLLLPSVFFSSESDPMVPLRCKGYGKFNLAAFLRGEWSSLVNMWHHLGHIMFPVLPATFWKADPNLFWGFCSQTPIIWGAIQSQDVQAAWRWVLKKGLLRILWKGLRCWPW